MTAADMERVDVPLADLIARVEATTARKKAVITAGVAAEARHLCEMTTISLSWGDRPIALETVDGRMFLRIGAALRVDVTDASLDQLDRLADVAVDLADRQRDRHQAADVADQVAAEDGHRFVGVPFQRGPVAA